jgi:hypothetical protein
MHARMGLWIVGPSIAAALLVATHAKSGDKMFRCESGGKITYSDRGCGNATEQVIEPGALNSFTAEPAAKRTLAAKSSSSGADRKARNSSIAIEQQKEQLKCQRLADRLTNIEVKLRRGYTLEEGERLREQRRQLEQQRRTERCR